MTTTTIDTLAALSGSDLAREIGCDFTGDCNYTEHYGTFYDARDWTKYGYASCVRFIRLDDEGGRLLVECGTINRCTSIDDALACCGFGRDGLGRIHDHNGEPIPQSAVTAVEIECCLAWAGAEMLEDFSGPYVKTFDDGTDDETILASVIGWIRSLAS